METIVKWANWDEIPEENLKRFSKMFLTNSSNFWIKNVQTEFRVLQVGSSFFLPITINHEEWENCFVCSPYTAYALYSKEELKNKIDSRWVQLPILFVINILAKILRSGKLNQNIQINNYLLSTNPIPIWDGEGIREINQFLQKEYPNHAVIIRSLNKTQHDKLIKNLKHTNYQLIASRQIYLFDLKLDNWLNHRNNKNDNKLIQKQGLTFLNHDEMGQYLEDALALYYKLYIKKYSIYNPQFTLEYFKYCHLNNIVIFQGYKNTNGELKAFSGLFIVGKTITSPLIGYDTDAPQNEGLYIHAAQLALLYKLENPNLELNLSSGAAGFKRSRGGQPEIEYSAVSNKHLSLKNKIVWHFLKFVSNQIGIPLLKKYKL